MARLPPRARPFSRVRGAGRAGDAPAGVLRTCSGACVRVTRPCRARVQLRSRAGSAPSGRTPRPGRAASWWWAALPPPPVTPSRLLPVPKLPPDFFLTRTRSRTWLRVRGRSRASRPPPRTPAARRRVCRSTQEPGASALPPAVPSRWSLCVLLRLPLSRSSVSSLRPWTFGKGQCEGDEPCAPRPLQRAWTPVHGHRRGTRVRGVRFGVHVGRSCPRRHGVSTTRPVSLSPRPSAEVAGARI